MEQEIANLGVLKRSDTHARAVRTHAY